MHWECDSIRVLVYRRCFRFWVMQETTDFHKARNDTWTLESTYGHYTALLTTRFKAKQQLSFSKWFDSIVILTRKRSMTRKKAWEHDNSFRTLVSVYSVSAIEIMRVHFIDYVSSRLTQTHTFYSQLLPNYSSPEEGTCHIWAHRVSSLVWIYWFPIRKIFLANKTEKTKLGKIWR